MKTKYFVCLPLVMLLASCAQDTRSGNVYRQGDVEQSMGNRNGIEINVRLNEGGSVSVVQEVSREYFRVGDSVRVLRSGSGTRVAH